MLSLLMEAPARYPARWLALDRRFQVLDHSADLAPLQARMLERGASCTFFFIPAPQIGRAHV